jgi:predicted dehydrogenase
MTSTAPRARSGSTKRTRTPSGSINSATPRQSAAFRKILTGPAHPDYAAFCQGPGHGTGYQDQIIIEAKDFLTAIETGTSLWPTFRDGMAVNQVVAAAFASDQAGAWVDVASV